MKLNKRNLPQLAASVAATMALSGAAMGQSSDALIDKLVEKGILNVKEANALREETDKGFNQAYATKTGMPEWVNSLKFSGDVRGRYEGFWQGSENAAPNVTEDRTRFRYRMRLGAVASMSDNLEVGMRLSSGERPGQNANGAIGGGDPVSPNTTLGDNASRKFVYIDLAYGKWAPREWFQAEVGKMNNPFWMTDMIFDPDYNPEGAQEKFTLPVGDKHSLNFTSGQYVIDENFSANSTVPNANRDVYLFINQLDFSSKWTPKISTRVGVAMMNFMNRAAYTPAPGTSGNANGAALTANNLNPVIGRAEATYLLDSFPIYKGAFPITVGAEYINNTALSADNQAYNLGIAFGSSKAKGGWQLGYNYKTIENASTWAGFNDSDFGYNGSGGSNVRGHVIRGTYRIYDPLTFGMTYFLTESILGPKAEQARLQVDMVWSF